MSAVSKRVTPAFAAAAISERLSRRVRLSIKEPKRAQPSPSTEISPKPANRRRCIPYRTGKCIILRPISKNLAANKLFVADTRTPRLRAVIGASRNAALPATGMAAVTMNPQLF